MPDEVIDYVKEKAGFTQKKFTNLAEGIHHVDIVYVTRIQKERFVNQQDYLNLKGSYVLTPKLLDEAAREDDDNANVFGSLSVAIQYIDPLQAS